MAAAVSPGEISPPLVEIAGSRWASDLHNLRSGTYFVGLLRCLGAEGTDCRSDRH